MIRALERAARRENTLSRVDKCAKLNSILITKGSFVLIKFSQGRVKFSQGRVLVCKCVYFAPEVRHVPGARAGDVPSALGADDRYSSNFL